MVKYIYKVGGRMSQRNYTYNPSQPLMESDDLIIIGRQLASLGFLKSSQIGTFYDYNYWTAVKSYQKSKGLSADGRLTESLIQQLEDDYAEVIAQTVSSSRSRSGSDEKKELFIEDSFFGETKETTLRSGGYSIVLIVGDDNQYKRTLTDVRMRSKTIQVDASGNPVTESYEFIAKDLKENTEPTD